MPSQRIRAIRAGEERGREQGAKAAVGFALAPAARPPVPPRRRGRTAENLRARRWKTGGSRERERERGHHGRWPPRPSSVPPCRRRAARHPSPRGRADTDPDGGGADAEDRRPCSSSSSASGHRPSASSIVREEEGREAGRRVGLTERPRRRRAGAGPGGVGGERDGERQAPRG